MFQSEQINFPILIIVGTITFSVFVIGIFIITKAYQKKVLEKVMEKQLLETQFSQTLLQSQVEIQEQTLRHISRELHDNLGQIASLIKINLNTLKMGDTPAAHEKVEDTKELTRQLITDIKSLSVSLGSDRLTQVGFVKAVQIEADRLTKTGEFEVSFETKGAIPEIDKDKAVILYRMVQEILNNIVKHSGAKQIRILLTVTENSFKLAIDDDGIGFNAEEKINSPGAGLRNLQSRALLLSAQLHVQSSSGSGTAITIELPL